MPFNYEAAKAAGYSDEEIQSYLSSVKDSGPSQVDKGIASRAWEALSIPEKKSREGLDMLAGYVPEFEPTGNAVRDVGLNTPKILAETLAETAPSFVSPEALATTGGMRALRFAAPAIKSGGRYIGEALESGSGLVNKTPGVLAEATADPSLFFGKGKKAAGKLYESAKNMAQVSPDIKTEISNSRIIQKALDFFNKGELTADEALIARQAVDKLPEKLPKSVSKNLRDMFDSVAKSKFKEADEAYSRAIKSESLRTLFPINKTGGPSIVRGGIATVLPPTALLFSPAIQGASATAIGGARKLVSPATKLSRKGIGLGLGLGSLADR